jgi:GNAT superfamily N-acetyltransferase
MAIRILEYDQVDPLGVLNLNLLSLNYALTPERVALIRQHDLRPFPFFGVYAVDDGFVAGQVGVYRLSMMTAEGPEDVGGVCAVCTHPAYSGRGIATQLIEEAHHRMRAAGLRFSTLGTARHRGAYSLYCRLGYEDLFAPSSILMPCSNLAIENQMRAERAGADRLNQCGEVFRQAAAGLWGFAIRHNSFMETMVAIGDVGLEDVWLLWNDKELVGYALAKVASSVLIVSNLLLTEGYDAATALGALARNRSVDNLRVRVDHSSVVESLQRAGYPPPQAEWTTFMVKSLVSEVTADDAREFFGVASERFLISCIDVT